MITNEGRGKRAPTPRTMLNTATNILRQVTEAWLRLSPHTMLLLVPSMAADWS